MMTNHTYQDGAEQWLADFFSRSPSPEEIQEMAIHTDSFAVRYHLAEERKNLLSWFPMHSGTTVLEIGAGCGALTGAFLEKGCDVTALELNPERAKIIQARYKQSEKLQVVTANIFDDFDKQFHIVSLIGVLEYAHMFSDHPKAAQKMIEKALSHLLPGGKLLVAIENKYGLKYWAGAPEDHTGKVFESISNYPEQRQIKTYGKQELTDVITAAGGAVSQWHYPLPDYKFPEEIFSNEYLPSRNHPVMRGIFENTYGREREHLFNEAKAMKGLVNNSAFSFFANSFLVVIEKQ